MYARLLGFAIFTCSIILNESLIIITKNSESVSVADETSTSTRNATLLKGYVFFTEDKAAYKIHDDVMTWVDARDRCIAEGARLAVIDSVAKIRHVNSITTTPRYKRLHVGIYKSEATNLWVEVGTDLPLTSIPWAKHHPDGFGNCAGVLINWERLVNYPCEYEDEYFVCEILL